MSDLEMQNDSSKEARGQRLSHLRGLINLSRAAIERKYGIDEQTLKGWERGRFTGLTEQGAKAVLTVMQKEGVQCSIGWLLHGTGLPPVELQEGGEITDQIDLGNETTDPSLIQELELFCTAHPHAITLQVPDDAMEPYYFEGDYVAGRRCYQQAIQALIGQSCIVETQMGDLLLRRVREGSKEGLYTLQCMNLSTTVPSPIQYDVELASAAPVIWHRRPLIK